MKYRKKPVVIEAEQFTKEMALSVLVDKQPGPFGLSVSGNYHPERRELYSAYVSIRTLEGTIRADIGDWIIRSIKGELYPCKPDIFAATYEPEDILAPVTLRDNRSVNG